MPVDDNPPRPEATPAPSGRRRRTRSWSTPSASSAEAFDGPLTDRDWNRSTAAATASPTASTASPAEPAAAVSTPAAPPAPGRRPIAAPPPVTLMPTSPEAAPGPDLVAALAEVRAEVAGLRAELAALAASASTADATRVTGAELAASIDALGTTLGTGLAALLTEHRNLLARDVEAAADRILDELGKRLRTSSTQTIAGVEERARHISAQGFGDLSAQLDLRLDQIESDVSGLRAVMLEIPDQTTVVERLDQLVGATPPRRLTALRPSEGPEEAEEAEEVEEPNEPVIPVTTPSPRAGKAPLRATPTATPTPKRAAKRGAKPPARAEEAAPEVVPARAAKTKERAARAPRTARAAGISADVETGIAPKRAARRAKR